jgi:hypothetical protein
MIQLLFILTLTTTNYREANDSSKGYCAKVVSIDSLGDFNMIRLFVFELSRTVTVFSEREGSPAIDHSLQVGRSYFFYLEGKYAIKSSHNLTIMQNSKGSFYSNGKLILEKGEPPYLSKNIIGLNYVNVDGKEN